MQLALLYPKRADHNVQIPLHHVLEHTKQMFNNDHGERIVGNPRGANIGGGLAV
jgi:hypothetical protein